MPEQRSITDTQRLKVEQLSIQLKELYKIIVTGDPFKEQISLLETIRNMAKDIVEIKEDRTRIKRLEERVGMIEDRHKLIDEQKKRIDEQRKRWGAYEILIVGTLLSNIIALIMWLLGVR